MEPLKIKDLYALLDREISKGHGEYVVFVTDDEEANGYHALWFAGAVANSYKGQDRQYLEDSNCDLSVCENTDEAYYLG